MPPQGEESPSFPAWIPQSTHDSAERAQTPPNTVMHLKTLGYISPFEDFGYFSLPPPGSPQIDFSDINNFPSPADGPGDRRPCSTHADLICGTGNTTETEIQHLEEEEEEDAQRLFHSWKRDVERILFEEPDHWMAPDERVVVVEAPAPEDGGRPYSADAADMPEVNSTAPVPSLLSVATRRHVKEEVQVQRRFDSFNSTSTIEQGVGCLGAGRQKQADEQAKKWIYEIQKSFSNLDLDKILFSDISTEVQRSIVRFTPDSKDRNTRQGCWKQTSMTGMRAEPLQPGQQGYIGLKKTLELQDGSGTTTKWRAYEYTPLLPPDDDASILVSAGISLRIVFEDDEPAPSSKRPRSDDGPSKGPKISNVWEHMTRVHIKVATDNADGSSKRKQNPYKVMYAICHHCDKVFNADTKNGTNNQLKHLANCKCDCSQSN